MKKATLLLCLVCAPVFLCAQNRQAPLKHRVTRLSFSVVEASIPEMQAAMKDGRVTSRDLVLQYLTRIALYNRRLNAIITVNPNALREAEELDRERAAGHVRGPLHGIPIALKDNI
jgi:amidase